MKKRISTIYSGNRFQLLSIAFALLLVMSSVDQASAQNETDVLRYSRQYPSYDPVTMVMPGVAYATGFGAYQENPAVMALFNHSFYTGGLSDHYVSEEARYLGNSSTYDINSLGISHAGVVFKFPTSRGSLVIGGGYSQTTGYNRAASGHGYNKQTTITDSYILTPDDVLFFAAFDAYVIDYATPDEEYSQTASIFRVDSPYKGIQQRFEITEQGGSGEYSAFIATELFKNFMVGASIGAITGSYTYERNFIEVDKKQMYETQFKDNQGNLIGIQRVLNEDDIETTFTGFSIRFGALYQITPHLNIGLGYQFANVIYLKDEFNTQITNRLDDGYQYKQEAPGKIEYRIKRPSRFTAGVTLHDFHGFTLSAALERVPYSSARIRFDGVEYNDLESTINSNVIDHLQDVVNYRFGVAYKVTDRFTPRIGYGYYENPNGEKKPAKEFFSGGFTVQVSQNVKLSAGAQYATWKDDMTLYRSNYGDEVVYEDVNRWNIMAGLTYYF